MPLLIVKVKASARLRYRTSYRRQKLAKKTSATALGAKKQQIEHSYREYLRAGYARGQMRQSQYATRAKTPACIWISSPANQRTWLRTRSASRYRLKIHPGA
jgi:hypothetical protein